MSISCMTNFKKTIFNREQASMLCIATPNSSVLYLFNQIGCCFIVVGWFLVPVLRTKSKRNTFALRKFLAATSWLIEYGKWQSRQASFVIVVLSAAISMCRRVAQKPRSFPPPGTCAGRQYRDWGCAMTSVFTSIPIIV